VADNADNLADLTGRIARRERLTIPTPVELPRPGVLADVILSKEIAALNGAGSYLALSDIDSWLVLPLFEVAQHEAVLKGVTVNRIFIITHPPSLETCRVLSRHYAYASKWTREAEAVESGGCYRVRFLNSDQLEAAQLLHGEVKHFGIFVPSQPSECAVEFKVPEPDLSTFTLTALEGTRGDLARFNDIWSSADDLDVALRVEYLLKLQLELLPDGGWYHVISDFHSWRNNQLASFHEETLNAIEKRGITAKRVFVRQPNEDAEACMDILRRHYADAVRLRHDDIEPYAVSVCRLDEAVRALGEKWHFGVFRAPARPGYKVDITLSEATEADMSDFVLDTLHDQQRAHNMEKFFRAVGPVVTRVRDVLGREFTQ